MEMKNKRAKGKLKNAVNFTDGSVLFFISFHIFNIYAYCKCVVEKFSSINSIGSSIKAQY